MKTLRELHINQSGQVLPMFVMLLVLLIGMIGLATDLGRIYVARAELGRSVDAAALAGAGELPNISNADDKAREFIAENEPDASIVVEVYPNVPSQQVEVRATKNVNTIFMRLFGISNVTIKNSATAGFGVIPVDAVMSIDATGSMGASPCDAQDDNAGCPIWEAKNAAKAFTNTLLPGSNTVVGNVSYRGCYNTPNTNSGCVSTSTLGALTSSAATLITKIDQMTAVGGTGTNTCLGLDKAYEVLTGAGSHSASNTSRIMVVLADGDNTYNSASYVSGSPGHPPAACRPTNTGCPVANACSPSSSQTFVGTGCSASGQGSASSSNAGSSSETKERQLDTFTNNRATSIKSAGVEIYVVGFGVCGTANSTVADSSYCSGIGNSSHDGIADQRLLKCIASSSPGTNDHYYPVTNAEDLPGVFEEIAQNIAFRLIK